MSGVERLLGDGGAYRFLLGDVRRWTPNEIAAGPVNETIRGVLRPSSATIEISLNEAGSAQLEVPLAAMRDISMDDLEPGSSALYIEREGFLLWSGPIWTVSVTATGDEASATIGAEGWFSVLDRLVIQRPSTWFLSPNTFPSGMLPGDPQNLYDWIAWMIVAKAEPEVARLTYPDFPVPNFVSTIQPRYAGGPDPGDGVGWHHPDHPLTISRVGALDEWLSVGDIIREAGAVDGPQGFDFRQDGLWIARPTTGPVWHDLHPKPGSGYVQRFLDFGWPLGLRQALALELGSNVAGIEFASDGSTVSRSVVVTGPFQDAPEDHDPDDPVPGGYVDPVVVTDTNDLDVQARLGSAGSELPSPRTLVRALTLPDGRVLVAGGADREFGGAMVRSRQVLVLDPAAEQEGWVSWPGMNRARASHTLTLVEDRWIYAIGGLAQDESDPFAVVERLDLEDVAAGWEFLNDAAGNPLPFPHTNIWSHGAVFIKAPNTRMVYVVDGINQDLNTPVPWIHQASVLNLNNTLAGWQDAGEAGSFLDATWVADSKGRVWGIGGGSLGFTVKLFDTATGNLDVAVEHLDHPDGFNRGSWVGATAIAVDTLDEDLNPQERIYVIGGRTGSTVSDRTVWSFVPDSPEEGWKLHDAETDFPRSAAGATVISPGTVMLVGGTDVTQDGQPGITGVTLDTVSTLTLFPPSAAPGADRRAPRWETILNAGTVAMRDEARRVGIQELRAHAWPAENLSVTMVPGWPPQPTVDDQGGTLQVGDEVWVQADRDWLQIAAWYRVQQIKIALEAEAETVTYELAASLTNDIPLATDDEGKGFAEKWQQHPRGNRR